MTIGSATSASSTAVPTRTGTSRRPRPLRTRGGPGGGRVGGGAQPGRDDEQDDHDHELHQRQRRRRAQVEERRGEQVDLRLDGRVAHPAEGEHHTERGGAEEEDHARRAHDRRSQGRQGDRAEDLPRRRTQRGGGLTGTAVQRLPGRADRPDDDGHVEEHQPRDDRDGGAVEAEATERSRLPEQLPEGDADHDGGEHERHQQRRPDDPPPRQGEPVQRVRRGQPEQDGDRRGDRRGPDGEPRDPEHPRAGQHLEHTGDVELAVDEEALRDHGGHREHEEHPQQQHRPEGQQRQDGEPPHLLMTSVHSVSHCSRFAAMSAGATS